MVVSCIAIDDEPIALEIIKAFANKIPFLLLTETFLSATIALTSLQRAPVDLVFLDIQMPDLSGVELAGIINNKTKIIFTTAYADYAIKGFELDVVDYLLKPIKFDRFLQSCKRVYEQLNNVTNAVQNKGIFIRNGYELVKVHLEDLLYIEANDNYLVFHEPGKKTLTRMTLLEATDRLPSESFARIHKSFVVNLAKIDKIEKHQVTIAGISIPLSPLYQKKLFGSLKLP